MKETQHTPGPWFVPARQYGTYYVEARIGGGMLQEVASIGPTERFEQQEANARLIAAAPDLLFALKECSYVLTGESLSKSRFVNALELARDAMKKATGEQS